MPQTKRFAFRRILRMRRVVATVVCVSAFCVQVIPHAAVAFQAAPSQANANPKPEVKLTPAQLLVVQAREQIKNSQWDLALETSDKALALEPTNAGAFVARGMALNGKRDYDAAIAEFDKTTAQGGRDPLLLVHRADAYAHRSVALYQKGQYLDAINSAYFALLEKNDHHEAHHFRAVAYIARSQFDKAINSTNRAIGAKADYAEAYSTRGVAYAGKGNDKQALADQDKALELQSDLAIALQRRGSLHAKKGDLVKAIQDLDQAVKVAPQSPDALCDRAFIYGIGRDLTKAAADIEAALKLDPSFPKAKFQKGMMLLDAGEFDAAIKMFDESIALGNMTSAVFCFRGYAHSGNKSYELAIKDFSEALKIDSKNTMALSGRSTAYRKSGNSKEAGADASALKKLQPPEKKTAKKGKDKEKSDKDEPPPRFMVSSKPVHPDRRTLALASAKRIDTMVAANYAKHKVTPNPKTDDATFLRRIYLDITGTIPTYQQTRKFLGSSDPDKREDLIDELLNSDGYASHYFNYWADVLRYTDNLNGNDRGEPYRQWIKQSLAENKPWDNMVFEMLTAEGLIWNNPATGYLQRDAGMPLDNMNNTVRIFLGTRIGCAQCHNHPFDRWTQKEFYQMAAFTFGTLTNTGGSDTRYWDSNPNERLQEQYEAIEQEEEDRRNNSYRFNRLIGINMRIVNDQPARKITLPKDYAYDDAKPGDVIAPKALFGEDAEIRSGETPRQAFARWLTSTENPRFALTIANRLWKQAFGIGQIEPVDDMMDDTVAENPELMQHLEKEMKRLKFDMKEFLRILFNTETYQREACYDEVVLGAPYHFPGPILRRMTAEQVWDSFITLAVVDPYEYRELPANYRTDIIGVDLNEISAEKLLEADSQGNVIDGQQGQRQKKYTYKGVVLARASELPSPVPASHFLRMFGQSDRELISASSTMGSVPQVLFMFNGPISHMMLEKNSTIYNNVMRKKTVDDGVRAVFWTILNRDPAPEELELAKEEVKQNGPAGYGNIVWSLVNTREFLFIQ
ncbi:MAG: DUF1549 domain-containing protein [Planctomycetota bacterium]|nr:DUF1549 domain-containing protein [Planctomycetota bacterium]MDA1213574.1 DUF1549 domain-containing protein [Planctomycetota bacterium]